MGPDRAGDSSHSATCLHTILLTFLHTFLNEVITYHLLKMGISSPEVIVIKQYLALKLLIQSMDDFCNALAPVYKV